MVASQREARYAMVLGMSILKTWNYNYTLPDLRLIVITPTNIQRKSLLRLEEIGWGICYIKRIDYLIDDEQRFRVKSNMSASGNIIFYPRTPLVSCMCGT